MGRMGLQPGFQMLQSQVMLAVQQRHLDGAIVAHADVVCRQFQGGGGVVDGSGNCPWRACMGPVP